MNASRSEGQTLVLFALVLTVLIGFAALVVDIGFMYASERRYQAVADAAALAGAQDLQPATRGSNPTADERVNARADALRVVLDGMIGVGTTSTCATNSDIVNCELPGGQFRVSIRTPSPNCPTCDQPRSVQVTIREDEHPVTFARLFGQTTWDLSRTSVAGVTNAPNYTIVALRPIRPRSGSSDDVRDIFLTGGTRVRVIHGDVGTNSNMDYASCPNTLMDLDAGYRMHHYDDPPDWLVRCSAPAGKHIGSMIEDPNYDRNIPPPPSAVAQIYSTMPMGKDVAGCPAIATDLLTNPLYADYRPYVPVASGIPKMSDINCYRPGQYNVEVSDRNNELTILEPGLYYFMGGLDIQSSIIGGFNPGEPGVTLVFPRDKQFKQRNGAVALNAGTKFPGGAGAEPLTAPAMTGTVPNLKITIAVQRDGACRIVLPYDTGCHDLGGPQANETISLAGGTALYLAGVQYAPTDNVVITGSSDGNGYVGQVWAWTLKYAGGVSIRQEGLQPDGPGIIRIHTACSPSEPQVTCN